MVSFTWLGGICLGVVGREALGQLRRGTRAQAQPGLLAPQDTLSDLRGVSGAWSRVCRQMEPGHGQCPLWHGGASAGVCMCVHGSARACVCVRTPRGGCYPKAALVLR